MIKERVPGIEVAAKFDEQHLTDFFGSPSLSPLVSPVATNAKEKKSYKVESDLFRKDLGWTFKKKQWNHHLDLVGGFNPHEKY